MKVHHKATFALGVGSEYELVLETIDYFLCITNEQWKYVSALPKSHYEVVPDQPPRGAGRA